MSGTISTVAIMRGIIGSPYFFGDQPAMASSYAMDRDVVFGSGGGRDLHCDIYRPDEPNGGAVLIIHGGGWRQGSKDMLPPQAGEYAQAGYTCLACEYRLVTESAWPAQIHDVKAALRFLRARSGDYGVDPGKIAVHGNSAGAHLALHLAGTPGVVGFEGDGGNPGVDTSVCAVVAVYAPVTFYIGERTSGATNATALLGDAPKADDAEAASPMTYVHAGFPPTFFLHGNADKVVPVTASINMYMALARAGAIAEMHIYAEQPHGWARQPAWVGPTMDEACIFLDRYALGSGRYRVEGS